MTTYAPVEWNDSLETGVADVDRQHKILVNTLNDLAAKLSGRPNHQGIEQVTRDLLAYAIYHFETEEELIKRYGYDAAEPEEAQVHVQQHRGFTERVVALCAKANDGKSESRVALLSFLKDWLISHICTTDQRLGRFINTKSERTKLQ